MSYNDCYFLWSSLDEYYDFHFVPALIPESEIEILKTQKAHDKIKKRVELFFKKLMNSTLIVSDYTFQEFLKEPFKTFETQKTSIRKKIEENSKWLISGISDKLDKMKNIISFKSDVLLKEKEELGKMIQQDNAQIEKIRKSLLSIHKLKSAEYLGPNFSKSSLDLMNENGLSDRFKRFQAKSQKLDENVETFMENDLPNAVLYFEDMRDDLISIQRKKSVMVDKIIALKNKKYISAEERTLEIESLEKYSNILLAESRLFSRAFSKNVYDTLSSFKKSYLNIEVMNHLRKGN